MSIKRFLLVFLIISMAGCTDDDSANNPLIVGDDCVLGTGAITTEDRDLGNFTGIENATPGNVFITQGPLEPVRLVGPSNILELVRTSINNNTLNIRIDGCVDLREGIDIFVTIPQIDRLLITGVGNMTTENEIDADDLEITLAGVGNFSLQGSTNELFVSLFGTGDINAFGLTTDICDINISGVGNAEVFVNNELDVTITGAGTVFYRGTPTVTSTITGDGSVIDAN